VVIKKWKKDYLADIDLMLEELEKDLQPLSDLYKFISKIEGKKYNRGGI